MLQALFAVEEVDSRRARWQENDAFPWVTVELVVELAGRVFVVVGL